jgi:hypothetical protein
LTAWWEERATARLEAIANEVDPAQLVLLRISAESLPYSNPCPEFERSEGFIEAGPIRYRTIKKRVYNDSIEFLCIPDGATNLLRVSRDNFFRLVNDLQRPGHSKFPGQSGKTNPLVNNIVWLDTHHFPDLSYFAGRRVWSLRFIRPELPSGHARICLQPPRPDVTLS